MILSDGYILEELKQKRIVIEPFNKEYLNPCSVDLTLHPDFKIYKPGVLDVRKPNDVDSFTIPEEGYVLEPGKVYLYAVVLAVIASLESLLNLKAGEKLDKTRRYCSKDKELFAQGVGNFFAKGVVTA